MKIVSGRSIVSVWDPVAFSLWIVAAMQRIAFQYFEDQSDQADNNKIEKRHKDMADRPADRERQHDKSQINRFDKPNGKPAKSKNR